MSERIGIVGVGHLASFLIEGLHHSGAAPEIVVSPRNADRAAGLAARFGVRVARDNQAVADGAGLVILSTRPGDAVAAARAITFRPEQTVVSVVATLTCATLEPAVAPAALVRAMPISCATIGRSPTVIYPDSPQVRRLFERVGNVQVLPEESQFAAATSVAALYGWIFALMDRAADWAAAQGLPPELARRQVLGVVHGAASMGLERPETGLATFLESLATPGGLTEHGLRAIEDDGGLEAWVRGLEAALRRMAAAEA